MFARKSTVNELKATIERQRKVIDALSDGLFEIDEAVVNINVPNGTTKKVKRLIEATWVKAGDAMTSQPEL